MKNITYILFSLLLVSCSNTNKDCDIFKSFNIEKKSKIGRFYSEVENWPNSNWRMGFLKKYMESFNTSFDGLEESFSTNDIDLFTQSKERLLKNIGQFLQKTTKEQVWTNNEYFWIIRNVKKDIESYSFENSSKCTESSILKYLEFEESLTSVFYMMGYNDQFCFNKMEPIINQVHFLSMKDTTALTLGFYAFDSTQCNDLTYSIETSDHNIIDSTDCNWFYLPNGTGKAKIKGKLKYSLYGTEREVDFDEDIIVE